MNNVGLNAGTPVLNEATRLNVLQNGQFVAVLTDFAAIQPNRRLMVVQNYNLPISEEIYAKFIANVDHPTHDDWKKFDLKCLIKLGIDMYNESELSPGEASDINVALKDFNDLILNEEDQQISIDYLRNHLLLMTDKESHDLVCRTLLVLGNTGWEKSFTDIQVKEIDNAGKYLLEKTYRNDWRECFPTTIKYIKSGFKNQFAFKGNDYRRFMSFAHILAKHHADCKQLKGALEVYFGVTGCRIDSPEKVTQFLIHNVPRLRKFCVLVKNITKIP